MKKIFIILLSLLFCSTSFAAPFKQIIFFGDSLSDNGNLYQAIKIVPKSPPYYNGRFSNGPTWAENVGKYFYDKYYIDNVNYAYGGATAMLHNPLTDSFIAPITLEGELYSYYLHSLFTDKSKVLYVIWIGANDYLYEREPDVNALTAAVVNKISWVITSLMNQGAQDFLIMNLPDLAKTPYAKSNQLESRLHIISTLHNQKLADAVGQLQNKYPTIKFVTVDVYSSLNDLVANPDKFNQQYNQSITDVSEACWSGGFLLKGSASD
jgi:phospholipase/lecithinase/hemolysin